MSCPTRMLFRSGRYSFRDQIDDDGLSVEPTPIAVTLDVAGDHVTIDFAGSTPQVKAAINSTLSYTKSCAYLSVRCALTGDVPNNEGVFRCVTVKDRKSTRQNSSH